MFCTNCGANVPANSNFCGLCGAKITTPVAAESGDTINTDAPARTKPETAQFTDTSNVEAPARTKPEAVQFAEAGNIDAPVQPTPGTAPVKKMEVPGFVKMAFRKPKTTEEARTQVTDGIGACALIIVAAIWEAIAISPMLFISAAIFAACAVGLYYNSRAAAVIALAVWTINLIMIFPVMDKFHIDATDGIIVMIVLASIACWIYLVAGVRGTFALPKLAAPAADYSPVDEVINTRRSTLDFAGDQTRTEKKSRRGDRSVIVFAIVAVLVAFPVAWLLPDLGPGVSGGAAFLVTAAVALAATWIFEKIVYRPPRK